ncbi:MAG TPA: hypothetical protein EYQ45_03605 [Flavobacteriaceae bacterium]|nr:hypothetical protein [Flavobacteriaceae bacterium]
MSIWKKFGDERDEFFDSDDELHLDKDSFEAWLDSINESGDPARDEEYYNKEMAKQAEYPQVVVQTPDYTMTYSNN